MAERAQPISDGRLLRAFRAIQPELLREDLSVYQMEMVQEEHQAIVEKCLDRGLTGAICGIRDKFLKKLNEHE